MTTLRNSRRGTELRMPEQMELRQEIEALATKVVVEDLSSEAGFDQSLLALAGAGRGGRGRARAGGQAGGRRGGRCGGGPRAPGGGGGLSGGGAHRVGTMRDAGLAG